MKDYTYLYRDELDITAEWPHSWDLFISGFNQSERVQCVSNKVVANTKHWIIHNEYQFPVEELPSERFVSSMENEADFILEYFDTMLSGADLSAISICIDITGFMRPHMMFLVKYLVGHGVRKFDVIYSEPRQYSNRERTEFSDIAVTTVRQVTGFEGINSNDASSDMLVIGAGYESHLISEVADDKEKAERVVILGLPSLRADMYQQNRLRVHEAADSIGDTTASKFFAPANDPFVTATVLSQIVHQRESKKAISNLYLAPLATKAQALGFVIFYLKECTDRAASILYPFSAKYAADTSQGVSRVWLYRVEI